MHTPYQTNQRAAPAASETSRHTYIPPPPPPSTSAPGTQSHGLPIPPPPPRPPPNQSHGGVMHLPPGTSSTNQYGWPGSWTRQPFAQQQYLSGQHATYNPNAYYPYQSTPVAAAAASSQDPPPLTSATYIPDGKSFGPGVGIPPLNPGQIPYQPQRPLADPQHTFFDPDALDYPSGGDNLHSGQFSGPTSDFNAQVLLDVSRSPNNEPVRYYTQKHGPTGDLASSTSPHSQTHRPSDGSTNTPITPQDSGAQWSLDRVLSWLVSNSFSADWQKTFKVLDIHGSQFLDLGRGPVGRGNGGLLISKIFPQLAKECTQSGSGWDQAREGEERKRLRKLIKNIVDSAPSSAHKFAHRPSENGSGQEGFSDANREDGVSSTPTTAGGGDESPNQQMASNSTKASSNASNPHHRFSPQKESLQSPQESSLAEPMNRTPFPETILNGVGDEISNKRHSPIGLRELNTNTLTSFESRSKSSRLPVEGSPQLNPSPGQTRIPSGSMNGTTPSTSHGQSYHRRGRSSDSSYSVLVQDGRKHGQDVSRTNAAEGSGRPNVNESLPSAKESKGFLKFRRKNQKRDDLHPSPEELYLESPASPGGFHSLPVNSPYEKPHVNSSDTSLDRARSRFTLGETEKSGRNASKTRRGSTVPRKFVMVTPDGWHFRLFDVSEVHSADLWRSILCDELDLPDTKDLTVFITHAGQYEHNDALSDAQLMQNLQKADSTGNLKMFVWSPQRSAGPTEILTPETELHLKEKQEGLERSRISLDSPRSISEGKADRAMDFPADRQDSDGKTSLQIATEEHRRELERKPKAYRPDRKNRLPNPSPTDTGSIKRRDGVINFDEPRISPFEGTKMELLVPRRKPPPVPPGSKTLEKANSLSRRPSTHSKYPGSDRINGQNKRASDEFSSEHNAETGRTTHDAKQDRVQKSMQTAITIQDSGISPGSPGFMISKGNVPFRIPDYDPNPLDDDELDLNKPPLSQEPTNAALVTIKASGHSDSPDTSPSTVKPTKPLSRKQTRKSIGPTFVFKEPSITFDKSPAKTSHNSSDDSDDGLFAIPLKSGTKKKSSVSPLSATSSQRETSPEGNASRSERPSLRLKTSRSGKGLSVAFESPKLAPSPVYSAGDHSAGSDRILEQVTSTDPPLVDSSWSAESPNENFKDLRRQSFASDVWASRPPAEALVEHLDEFFPNVDLDQPALEDLPISPTASPGPSRPFRAARIESMESIRSDGDILNADSAISKRVERAQAIPRRSVPLGRTKSIREVVKGAYPHSDKPAIPGITRINTLKAGDIGRRKSTKMFGAKIEQIRALKGSKLSNLQTIPQDTLPQRQLTFKWVKGQLIGKGTFGRVYLGMNTTTGELLAVKQVEVNTRLAGQDKDKMKEMVKALDQEIDTMQHLDHVNIVQYLGCERKEYSISIFLEYIPGGSVGSCLRKHGKFEEPVVSSLTRQTLLGLAYLHHEGILHRDLKADNILLDNDGTCKISDFGISKKTDNIYGNDVTNSMQGSVFWMAPEVIRSQDSGYSAKVDIWSLGCVVLEMFAGRRPWSKEEAIGAIYKLGSLNQAPPIPDDVASAISPAALSFMYDCFNVDPADRPTADTLLRRAPFCFNDPHFNFLDTDLYAKIRPNFDPVVAEP